MILGVLYTLAVVLFLFGLTIFVHELGHYLVARKLGLVVETFSIGFGPAIVKWKKNGITYKIGCLPLGGYVALPQMDPGGLKDDEEKKELPPLAAWKRIPVAAAGVIGNMILAFILAYIIYWAGQSYAPEQTNIIGYVTTNSAAHEVGVQIGDVILSAGQDADAELKPVRSWDDFQMVAGLNDHVVIELQSVDGTKRKVELATESFLGGHYVPGILPKNYAYVLSVRPGSSAEKAGLESGDRIVSFDGIELQSREHLVSLVDQYRDQPVSVELDRDGKLIEKTVTPQYMEEYDRALIGVEFQTLDVRPPLEQVRSHATIILRVLKALVTPKDSKAAAKAVGGPLAILTMFWLTVQSSFLAALSLTCLVNVNLAVINLIPLPILDGGHIVFALWEVVTHRPVPRKVVDVLGNIFFVLIIALFLLLTVRDAKRLPSLFGRGAPEKQESVETNSVPVD